MRHLLQQGNAKLGESIHTWSLPAVDTCPGRSSLCERECYATKGRFAFPVVKESLAWCLEQSKLPAFADLMVDEIKTRGVMLVRVHVSGDFYDQTYALKWLTVMKRCRKTRFWWYSRSWRVPSIKPLLDRMANLSNCTGWMSSDAETGIPKGKVAYMQVSADDLPENAGVVFRVRRLRKLDSLPIVCPAETRKGGNCGGCQRCF